MHINGIDYNSERDEIIFSCWTSCEVYIIDHSTTTAEAAGSIGGTKGFGGDFLWRWGNPEIYGKGTNEDQVLFQQHNPNWIQKNYFNQDRLLIFNNGYNRSDSIAPFSEIIEVEIDYNNPYSLDQNGKFEPANPIWIYTDTILERKLYSDFMSGVNGLPNGNILICEATSGRFMEIDRSGELKWLYINPAGLNNIQQYLNPFSNYAYRAEYYTPDFEGLENKDLSGKALIEGSNILSEYCNSETPLNLENNTPLNSFFTSPNPSNKEFRIISSHPEQNKRFQLFDSKGVLVRKDISPFNKISNLTSGIYFVVNISENKKEVIKHIVTQ